MFNYTNDKDMDHIIDLCKEFAWENTLATLPAKRDLYTPQLVLVSDMAHYLSNVKYPAYKTIDDHKWLMDILQAYVQENCTVSRSWLSYWAYLLIPESNCLEHASKLKLPPFTYPSSPKKDDFFFVIFPPSPDDTLHNFLPKTDDKDYYKFKSYCPPCQPIQDTLSIELYDFLQSHIPSKEAQNQRANILRKISVMLQDVWPDMRLRLEVFGSSVNGLDFENSDLDLCIVVPSEIYQKDLYNMSRLMNEPYSVYNMHFVEEKLREIGMLNVKAITAATVPICKFNDPVSNISCDINTNNVLGIDNSKLVKAYSFLDTRVRPFLYAIKYFVKSRDINESLKGTLSSYTYSLMSLWYLMNCKPPVIPNLQNISKDNSCSAPFCSSKVTPSKWLIFQKRVIECNVSYHNCVKVVHPDRPEYNIKPTDKASIFGSSETVWKCDNIESVGSLLKGFFDYFGRKHDFSQYGLSLRFGTLISKWKWRDSQMVVEDPFIIGRNVAGTSTFLGSNTIQNEFKRAYDLLNSNHTFTDITGPVDPRDRAFDPDTIEQRILQRNAQQLNNTQKVAEDYDYLHQALQRFRDNTKDKYQDQYQYQYQEKDSNINKPRYSRKANGNRLSEFALNERATFEKSTHTKSLDNWEIDIDKVFDLIENSSAKDLESAYTPARKNTRQPINVPIRTVNKETFPTNSSINSTDSDETFQMLPKILPDLSQTTQQMASKIAQENQSTSKPTPMTYAEITSPHNTPEAAQKYIYPNIKPSFSSVVSDNIKKTKIKDSKAQLKGKKSVKPVEPLKSIEPTKAVKPTEVSKPVDNEFKQVNTKGGFKSKIIPAPIIALNPTKIPAPDEHSTLTHVSIADNTPKPIGPPQSPKTTSKKALISETPRTAKPQKTMDNGKTFWLLDVPDYVDSFDILDVLHRYGDVVSLEPEEASEPQSLYLSRRWRFVIDLYKSGDVLPNNIELNDQYITITS
ncbi:hypothetical protein CLU79DRAFT_751962 [Phycomyces nitens]|nr:hypothetical protein CLU79DRAFT_751962 [Phycomyces nitens]